MQPATESPQSTQTQSPSGSISNTTSNPNILQIPKQETTLLIAGAVLVAVIVSVVLIAAKAKRKNYIALLKKSKWNPS